MCLLDDQYSIISHEFGEKLLQREDIINNSNYVYSQQSHISDTPEELNIDSLSDFIKDKVEEEKDDAPVAQKPAKQVMCAKCRQEELSKVKANNEESQFLDNTSSVKPKSEIDSSTNSNEVPMSFYDEVSEVDSLEEDLESGKRPTKFTRWKREDDKILFSQIQRLEGVGVISLEYINDLQYITPNFFASNIRLLADLSGWRGTLYQMIKRVQFLCSISEFTAREWKLFKRLLRLQIDSDKINLKKLHCEFPGKSFEYIEKHARGLYSISDEVKVLTAQHFKESEYWRY